MAENKCVIGIITLLIGPHNPIYKDRQKGPTLYIQSLSSHREGTILWFSERTQRLRS